MMSSGRTCTLMWKCIRCCVQGGEVFLIWTRRTSRHASHTQQASLSKDIPSFSDHLRGFQGLSNDWAVQHRHVSAAVTPTLWTLLAPCWHTAQGCAFTGQSKFGAVKADQRPCELEVSAWSAVLLFLLRLDFFRSETTMMAPGMNSRNTMGPEVKQTMENSKILKRCPSYGTTTENHSDTCPTCRGTGRIPRGGLSFVAPFSWSWLYFKQHQRPRRVLISEYLLLIWSACEAQLCFGHTSLSLPFYGQPLLFSICLFCISRTGRPTCCRDSL